MIMAIGIYPIGCKTCVHHPNKNTCSRNEITWPACTKDGSVHTSSCTTGNSGYMQHCMYTVYNDITHLVLHVDLCTIIQ